MVEDIKESRKDQWILPTHVGSISFWLMTLQQARKILGVSSDKYSDEIIGDFVQTAELLKTLFYEFIRESNGLDLCHNKLNINDKRKGGNLH